MKRNVVYGAVIVGLLAFVVVMLVPRDTTPETPTQRAHRIATQLRCPFCSGESIADARSTIAADIRDLIDEQIASGMTDQQIFDYYVSIYSERVLLSPPLLGWGLALWLLPLLLLGAGLEVMRRRRRAAGIPIVVASEAARTEARQLVAADLEDLELQEASGELDDAAAARLRKAYKSEDAALEAAAVTASEPRVRSRKRVAAGAAVLIAGAAALTVGVVVTIGNRAPGELVTGGIVNDAPRDLSTVTNEELEQVVAANPDVVPMRLALAARYFNEGNFSKAVEHYLEVLNREKNPEALANVGWMTYLSGETDIALRYIDEALAMTSELPQPYWYLANIRYHGLDDPAGAVEPLETLLAFDDLPDEVRSAATELLDEVRAAA